MTYVTVTTAQLFPHKATPTWIHHFSDYSRVCRHVNLTVSCGRCFREPPHLAKPYATILCLMMRPRWRTEVQSQDEKRKPTNTQIAYPKLIRPANDIVLCLFQEASVSYILSLQEQVNASIVPVWAALQVTQKVTSLLHYKRQLNSPQMTFKKCDQMNRFYAVLKMWLHTEHCV